MPIDPRESSAPADHFTEIDPLIELQSPSHEPGPFSFRLFLHESSILASLAWPVIASYILSYSLNVASVFSLGHVGTKELAACALATMLCNVTGFSVGQGMASALDTLCSQAMTGTTKVI